MVGLPPLLLSPLTILLGALLFLLGPLAVLLFLGLPALLIGALFFLFRALAILISPLTLLFRALALLIFSAFAILIGPLTLLILATLALLLFRASTILVPALAILIAPLLLAAALTFTFARTLLFVAAAVRAFLILLAAWTARPSGPARTELHRHQKGRSKGRHGRQQCQPGYGSTPRILSSCHNAITFLGASLAGGFELFGLLLSGRDGFGGYESFQPVQTFWIG